MQVLGTERYMEWNSELVPILIGSMSEMQTSILEPWVSRKAPNRVPLSTWDGHNPKQVSSA